MTTNPVVTVTDELLEELEQLASKATPGPWVIGLSADNGIHCLDAASHVDGRAVEVCEVWGTFHDKTESEASTANACLIAKANPATILSLLHQIRTMQQELKAAHISVDNCELFRKGADRYQFWSRTACYEPVKMAKIIAHCCTPDDLDAAIDAAMTASHVECKA